MYRAVIAAAALAAFFLAGWISNGWRLEAQANERQAEHAQELAAAVQKIRAEDNRRTNALLEALNAASADLAKATADRDLALAASDSLQQRAQALAASCVARGPVAPSASPPAPSPGHLLADMLGRLDRAAGEIAAHADRAMIAGRACERAYDSLGK